MSHILRWSPACSLTSSAWGKRRAMVFILMAQSCLAVHTHSHCFYCWVPCVIEITDCCDFIPNKYAINHTNNCLVHPFYMFGPSPFSQWRSSRACSKMERWFGRGMVMEDESPMFWWVGQWVGSNRVLRTQRIVGSFMLPLALNRSVFLSVTIKEDEKIWGKGQRIRNQADILR